MSLLTEVSPAEGITPDECILMNKGEFGMIQAMPADGITPDAVSYNAAITAHANAQPAWPGTGRERTISTQHSEGSCIIIRRGPTGRCRCCARWRGRLSLPSLI